MPRHSLAAPGSVPRASPCPEDALDQGVQSEDNSRVRHLPELAVVRKRRGVTDQPFVGSGHIGIGRRTGRYGERSRTPLVRCQCHFAQGPASEYCLVIGVGRGECGELGIQFRTLQLGVSSLTSEQPRCQQGMVRVHVRIVKLRHAPVRVDRGPEPVVIQTELRRAVAEGYEGVVRLEAQYPLVERVEDERRQLAA